MPFKYISRRAQMIRTFSSSIGKTAVIYPATFLQAVALGCLLLGVVFYMREAYGINKTQLGLFCASWPLCYLIGCVVVRPLTDRVLPRHLLAASTFVTGSLALLLHFSRSLPVASVCYGSIGLLGCLFWPPVIGWLSAKLEGQALGKAMSRFNVSWSVGGIVSAPLAGWLSQKHPALPLILAGGVMLLNSAMITGAALALPRIRNDRHTASIDKEHPAERNNDRSTRLRYAGWIGAFCAFTTMGVMGNIFPVSAKEDLLIAKPVIGTLLMGRAIIASTAYYLLGRFSFWHYRSSQMLIGQAALAGTLTALVYAEQPLTIAPLMILLGITIALGYSNSLFHGLAGSTNRTARSAVHEALLSAGLMCGALGGGYVYEEFSMKAVYQACAVLVAGGMVLQALIVVWARRRDTRPQPE